jgi:hypothetical protein
LGAGFASGTCSWGGEIGGGAVILSIKKMIFSMKFSVILLFHFGLQTILFSQPSYDLRRDYVWRLGYSFSNVNPINSYDTVGRVTFDFRTDSLIITESAEDNALSAFLSTTSICDSLGDLLFYSDGCKVNTSDNLTISGAEGINFGNIYENRCTPHRIGHSNASGLVTLPVTSQRYLTLSEHKSYIGSSINTRTHGLLKTIIIGNQDSLMAFHNNDFIFEDTIVGGQMATCRHANGRDWFLVTPKFPTNEILVLFIDKDTIFVKNRQSIGPAFLFRDLGSQNGVFSPDGTKYARVGEQTGIVIYDFDRCTGVLSNVVHIPWYVVPPVACNGLAISPNSRYLYFAGITWVEQFDLWATDIAASRIRVATWDNSDILGWDAWFGQPILAPNGKIYMGGPTHGLRSYHKIDYPDSAGLACHVVQHVDTFQHILGLAMPRFPNFRLGKIEGSPCDTIGLVQTSAVVKREVSLRLKPNPAQEYTVVDVTLPTYEDGGSYTVRLCDIAGRVLWRQGLSSYQSLQRIELGGRAAGVYWVQVLYQGRVVGVEKLVVVR